MSTHKNSQFADNMTTEQIEMHMNTDIYKRNMPSSSLQPYINARPVSTKYSIMPIVDPRKKTHVPLKVDPTYNVSQTFNPGNATAPWSGYASQVNVESELKNQVYALQHCDQSVYVPSSTSDLYASPNVTDNRPSRQNHPYLFEEPSLSTCGVVPENTQSHIFHNATRENIRESMLP